MTASHVIRSVAVYEAKILLRAWSFRIFALIGLTVLFIMNVAFATKISRVPYFFNSLAGSLPMMNIKLLNVYQGVIIAFLASDFIKRDRKHDSTEVIYVRSMTNAHYILGKTAGILLVFALLNAIVIAMGLSFHLFLSDTPFAFQPYLLYTVFLSLPTAVFMIGVSSMLMNLVRSQAIVFVLLLGFSVVSLLFLGDQAFYISDIFAYHVPIMYSDFVGLGNLGDLIAVRGAYLLLGIGLVALSILLMGRMRQSKTANVLAALTAAGCVIVGTAAGIGYLQQKYASREYRDHLRSLNSAVKNIPVPTVTSYSISLEHNEKSLRMAADLTIENKNAESLDSLLFSLNPGLMITEVSNEGRALEYTQNEHLLWVRLASALARDSSVSLSMDYSGRIDDRICYLDLSDERIEEDYMLWLYSMPKDYAFVEPGFVLLTPEAMWYPVPGLASGAAYPDIAWYGFPEFTLDVETDRGLVAISQGAVTIDTTSTSVRYSFEPECPLPQMSVAIGNYEERSIEVDSITYSLYTLPSHDYFEPYFDQVADTLPFMIRELKTDYEMQIGFGYPYERLICVEVPIQFYCHDRLWTYAQEMVQPQIVLLPELGTLCDGADFAWMKRHAKRRQERANLAESPQEIQAKYFNDFVRIDLLGIERGRPIFDDADDFNIEPRFHILPNYVSYSVHLSSQEHPVVNYALESYIFNRATPPQDVRWRSWRGLTEIEKANFLLRRHSLKDVMAGDFGSLMTSTVMKEKGRYLFKLLEAYVGSEDFNQTLTEFLLEHRFRQAPADSFLASFEHLSEADLVSLVDSWYNDTILPGYDIEDIEGYKVIDGERARSQIEFSITNPQPVDGVVTVGFRAGGRRDAFTPWWRRGTEGFDFERTVIVPAESRKQVGIVLDDPPVEMSVETYISRNIPSVLRKSFVDLKLDRAAKPFEGEELTPLRDESHEFKDQLIVDNEDTGFEVVTVPEESRFRRLLLDLFGSEEEDDDIPYQGLWFWGPPKVWVATTDSRFFGRFVHSGFYKAAGDGSQKVSWSISLEQEGSYDVSYYNPDIEEPHWRRRRGRMTDKGEQTFLVYHDDGIDEVVLDLNAADEGWNLLGTYHLSSGANRVELTDKSIKAIVTADAVKWVKR